MHILFHALDDGADGVAHGGVVAPGELAADVLQAHAGDLADDIHAHVARRRDVGHAGRAADHVGRRVVRARHLGDDLVDRHRHGLQLVQNVLDGVLRRADRRPDVLQQAVGVQLLHRALELTDVRLEPVRDVLRHVVRQIETQQVGLAAHDGHAHLKIGRLNVRDEAHHEAGAQTVVKALDLLRRAVADQHDLLARVVQRVERMEELLLRRDLARDELDVVHKQNVRRTVFVVQLRRRAVLDGGDDLVRERLAVHKEDVVVGMVVQDLRADGVQKMRLAEAGVAPDEQRVVCVRRVRGNGQRRRVRELVRGAHDEVVERQRVIAHPAVQHGFRARCLRHGRGRLHRLFLLFRHGDHHRHLKAHDLAERLFQNAEVPLLDDAHQKLRRCGQECGHAVKGNRLDAVDKCIVCRFQFNLLPAVFLYGRQNLFKRIHNVHNNSFKTYIRSISHSEGLFNA